MCYLSQDEHIRRMTWDLPASTDPRWRGCIHLQGMRRLVKHKHTVLCIGLLCTVSSAGPTLLIDCWIAWIRWEHGSSDISVLGVGPARNCCTGPSRCGPLSTARNRSFYLQAGSH